MTYLYTYLSEMIFVLNASIQIKLLLNLNGFK